MLNWLRKHYHWVIAATLLLQSAIYVGAMNNFSALHLIPVTKSLGISRTMFALSLSMRSIVGVGTTLFSGTLITRYGYQRMASVCLLIAALAHLLYVGAGSYGMFLAGDMVWGLSIGVCSTTGVGISRTVSAWFHKHRGTVLGLVASATGIGGSLLSLLQSALIEKYSWRVSLLSISFLTLICMLLTAVLMRDDPKVLGLQPYGEGETVSPKKSRAQEQLWAGRTIQELKRKPAFYLMILATLGSCVSVYMILSNLMPHLQDRGLSITQVSSINAMQQLLFTGTKLLAGYLCDRINAKRTTLLCLGCCLICLVFLTSGQGFAAAVAASVFFSVAVPLVGITVPLLGLELFGHQAQSQYTGIFMAMISCSSIFASPMANAVYDLCGSYNPAFYGGMVLCGLTAVVYLVLFRLAARDKKLWEAAQSVR